MFLVTKMHNFEKVDKGGGEGVQKIEFYEFCNLYNFFDFFEKLVN